MCLLCGPWDDFSAKNSTFQTNKTYGSIAAWTEKKGFIIILFY